jgi:hypothetical protein
MGLPQSKSQKDIGLIYAFDFGKQPVIIIAQITSPGHIVIIDQLIFPIITTKRSPSCT